MPTSDPLVIVRYLDVILVVFAAPFVVLMGGPVLGYAVAGGTWIVTRIGFAWLERRVRESGNARAQVGVGFAVLMGRAWLMGIAILVVGLAGDREDGLMAALLALVAFSVYFATQLIIRPMERNTPSS
jgi:peptidoglycan biosynthesis protein MviN/MurJ (putative lipid II flippase)